jgi:hypothetical protein
MGNSDDDSGETITKATASGEHLTVKIPSARNRHWITAIPLVLVLTAAVGVGAALTTQQNMKESMAAGQAEINASVREIKETVRGIDDKMDRRIRVLEDDKLRKDTIEQEHKDRERRR